MIYLSSFGVLWKDATKENSLYQNRIIVIQECEINISNDVKGVYEQKILFSIKELISMDHCR